MTKCSKCKIEKNNTDFPMYKGKLWYWCRDCQRQSAENYRKRYPERIKEQGQRYRDTHPNYSKAHSQRWRRENKEKYLKKLKEYRSVCIKRDPLWDHKRSIKNNYGISWEQYEDMYRSQNGTCYICGSMNISGRRLCVDHNHSTGEIRKLLCHNCNLIIGYAKENQNILESAARYLKEHSREVSHV